MEGNPRFDASQQLPDVKYAEFAQSLGMVVFLSIILYDLAAAWQRALSADRPVLLEVKTDPEVAPLPPAHHL